MLLVKTLIRGFASGVWGVVAMAGISFTVRRFVEPGVPLGKFHYESVVEAAHDAVTPDDRSLEQVDRIRMGEIAHLSFGGFWGMVFALLTRGRVIRPWLMGTSAGTVVWLGAFAGYMPRLKLSPALWDMKPYGVFRTWISHVVFAVATFLALRKA